MLFTYQSQAQSAKQSKGRKLIPPIFGQWRTGEILAIDNSTVKHAVPVDLMYDELRLLPAKVLVEFKIGFDKVAHEAFYEMTLMPPFPPESCKYGTLWATCLGEEGHHYPNPNQKPPRLEFSLYITKKDVIETFAAVGATTKDVRYQARGNGHSFEGNYFVSEDRQTMWAEVYPGATYIVESDGTRRETGIGHQKLQVYHRVPDVKKGR